MKRLIKRYVLQAQIDRESDDVNEGELNRDQPAPEPEGGCRPDTELEENWRAGFGPGEPPGETKADVTNPQGC